MESRKIQRVGTSTLAVSLPIEWAKKTGLKRGDLIYLEEDKDGMLKVIPKNLQMRKQEEKATVINADLCVDGGMLKRVITGNYAQGVDTIKVSSSRRLSGQHTNEIREAVRSLMGLGIMEETSEHVTLQCSLDVTKLPIDTSVIRLYMIASTMHKEAIEAFQKVDRKMAEETRQRKPEANTMFWTITRFLSVAQADHILARNIGIDDPMDLLEYRVVVLCLERIAAWSEIIARQVVDLEPVRSNLGNRLTHKVQEISDISYNLCHKSINCLYKGDIRMANNVVETYEKVQDMEEKLEKTICTYAKLKSQFFSVDQYFVGPNPPNPCSIAQLSLIIWSLRHIAELGSEIADISIHRALRKDTPLSKIVLDEKTDFKSLSNQE
jgi:phosphate uptake regulator